MIGRLEAARGFTSCAWSEKREIILPISGLDECENAQCQQGSLAANCRDSWIVSDPREQRGHGNGNAEHRDVKVTIRHRRIELKAKFNQTQDRQWSARK